MFDNLSERLERSFKILKGEGRITEINIAETVKDIRKALDLTTEYVKRTAVDAENCYAIVSHTDRAQYAELLAEKIRENVGFKKVFVSESFSGNATNIGTGMIGVYYFGEEVSPELEKEKAVMAEICGK